MQIPWWLATEEILERADEMGHVMKPFQVMLPHMAINAQCSRCRGYVIISTSVAKQSFTIFPEPLLTNVCDPRSQLCWTGGHPPFEVHVSEFSRPLAA